ncbi:hypothetical protein FSARC_5825 [Fusarium sarcochroum]|uniref:Uncharacterized protein n=1 Tax=Fusarium sarcochroum TaxID=1208366 RepID=A0A8H4XA07_9HYPO|nr:hypothetical protein FSARC_5825 [Fusarium sarcochroum]
MNTNNNSKSQGNSPQRPRRAHTLPQPISAGTGQILQQVEMLSIQLNYQHLSIMEMNRHLEALMYEVRVMRSEMTQVRVSIKPGLDRSAFANSEGRATGPATPDTISQHIDANYRLPENSE